MPIVGGLDVHRAQITFDYVDVKTGDVKRGRVRDPHRERFAQWLAREFTASEDAVFALEATTGWRYVVEEIEAAGMTAVLVDPAEVHARRGRKARAKTDRTDARFLRQLAVRDELPRSWVPPPHMLEARALLRWYRALVQTRSSWRQRLQAVAFHHGVAAGKFADPDARAALMHHERLTPAARRQVAIASSLIDAVDAELLPLQGDLRDVARRQPACRALSKAIYGVGPLSAVAIWAEVGDVRRFSSSDDVVRYCGLDVTVYSSDQKRAAGRLSHQGPSVVRWALYEAAKTWARASAPEHSYYASVKGRHDGTRAALSVARKMLRRSYHVLAALGDTALDQLTG